MGITTTVTGFWDMPDQREVEMFGDLDQWVMSNIARELDEGAGGIRTIKVERGLYDGKWGYIVEIVKSTDIKVPTDG